jgi:hypothetical protein
MKWWGYLAAGCLLLVSGSESGTKDKQTDNNAQLREWNIQFVEWVLTDQKAIRAWKDKKDRTIPTDVKVLAEIRLFRRDNENSVAIVHLGNATCGAELTPSKDNEGSWTSISFFYSSGKFGKGRPDSVRPGLISMDEDDLVTGKPIRIGSSSHGIFTAKGDRYQSLTINVTLVKVKKCDVKMARKVFSSYLDRLKRGK